LSENFKMLKPVTTSLKNRVLQTRLVVRRYFQERQILRKLEQLKRIRVHRQPGGIGLPRQTARIIAESVNALLVANLSPKIKIFVLDYLRQNTEEHTFCDAKRIVLSPTALKEFCRFKELFARVLGYLGNLERAPSSAEMRKFVLKKVLHDLKRKRRDAGRLEETLLEFFN
jgi:hypothetical protein